MAGKAKSHLFAANWKMHKTVNEALDYLHELRPLLHPKHSAKVYIAAPFTALKPLAEETKKEQGAFPIAIGAQNMSDHLEGAFTGEISAAMLMEIGVKFVILGHSERRRFFHEKDDLIHRKVSLAFNAGLQPLLCIGETAEERKAGKTEEILEKQLSECLKEIKKELGQKLIIAYEPVWAIGNGHAATPQDAEKSHHFIRDWLGKNWDALTAEKVSILYGGSVNGTNAKDFLKEKNIDGLLIGGASLTPHSFSEIINLN